MKQEQIDLIQQNFEKIAPRAEAVATVFYNRLFSMKPALQFLFPEDLTEQKKKLMTMLGMAIKSLNQTDTLVPILKNLGQRHAIYGVRDGHYDTVGAALLLTLRDALGRDFTGEAHAAWAEMYGFVAATMKSGASELARDFVEPDFSLQDTLKMPANLKESKTPPLFI